MIGLLRYADVFEELDRRAAGTDMVVHKVLRAANASGRNRNL